DDEIELLDALTALSLRAGRYRRAGGVAVISSSGGAGVLMSDLLETRGLTLATLSPETRAGIEAVIPAFGSAANPVDLTAQMIENKQILQQCFSLLLSDPAVGTLVVLWGGSYSAIPTSVQDLISAAEATDKIVVASMIGEVAGVPDQLRAHGIPVYSDLARCAQAVAVLDRYAQALEYRDRKRAAARPRPESRRRRVLSLLHGALGPADRILSEDLAKQVLALYGVPVTRQTLATTAPEARAAAEAIGYPVALKVDSPDILHKTEAGAIALNLGDAAAVETAFAEVLASAGAHAPSARIRGVQVQEMLPPGVEMLIGLTRDPVFGPVLTVGLGGIFVEVLRDVARGIPPLTSHDAEVMLDSLRAAPVLAGVRGAPPSDRAALVGALLAVSDLAVDLADLIEEMDVNPLIVGPTGSGAKAADALIVLRDGWREEPLPQANRSSEG
ncbi:MAG TPA: acetate--CoA ligase family protein, partial [Dehalococcoidia bacterium]|nr:acetate--CoA ligase family protein [Dehalococcoidia bacterium]